jgi:hypothetical protein
LLLGYAGAQPSDAADAAARLLPFTWHGSRLPNGQPGPRAQRITGTLGEVLETIIRGDGGQRYAPHLLLSLDGAEVHWIGANGEVDLIEVYGPPMGLAYTRKIWRLRRQVYLESHLTALAATLWRDTPRDENAGTPCQEAGARA